MKHERGVVDKLRRREKLGVEDALVLRRNSKRMGMGIGVREAQQLLRHLL
jgi:hypothetical protein